MIGRGSGHGNGHEIVGVAVGVAEGVAEGELEAWITSHALAPPSKHCTEGGELR